MSEFIPGICWQEFRTKELVQVNALINAGFKAIRIFFNLRDLPYIAVPNQAYIQHCFDTMPNGQHAWQFEGHANPNVTTEPMRATFDFCKKYNWLPIACMGTSEESVSGEWIGRVPNNFDWLGKFAHEFALYLKNTMGFSRADLEVFNEPSKVWHIDVCYGYCELALEMATAWKSVSPNYKVHVFADDLLRQDYLDHIMTHKELMNKADYISTHIGVGSEDNEWDRGLIQVVNTKISRFTNLSQAVTELSFNGKWDRLDQIKGKVAMYGIIGAIRNKDFGTATRIDDLWLYGPGDELRVTSQTKVDLITKFNHDNYKPYEIVEEEDMKLERFYYQNRPADLIKDDKDGYGIMFLRKCFGLSHSAKFDTALTEKVKAYQSANQLLVDGKVGPETFGNMILVTDYYKFYCWVHSLWARGFVY